MADEAETESPPPNGCKRLMRAAERGGEGRGGTPTQQRKTMSRSKGEGGDT